MSPLIRDRLLHALSTISALLALGVLMAIILFTAQNAWPALSPVLYETVTGGGWTPSEGQYGLFPMIIGSFLVSGGALLIAGPIGLFTALFLRYYGPPYLTHFLRRILELLAGVPSVVLGLWGLTTIVPLIARYEPPGASLMAAIVVLAIMIVPTVALLSDLSLAKIPQAHSMAATALGLSTHVFVWRFALPLAAKGIWSAFILAAARALGETMVVLMVAGNVIQIPSSLFDPLRTITANIALEMAYALDLHRAALFAGSFILFALTTLLIGGTFTTTDEADETMVVQ